MLFFLQQLVYISLICIFVMSSNEARHKKQNEMTNIKFNNGTIKQLCEGYHTLILKNDDQIVYKATITDEMVQVIILTHKNIKNEK